jgi:hypothetical protein
LARQPLHQAQNHRQTIFFRQACDFTIEKRAELRVRHRIAHRDVRQRGTRLNVSAAASVLQAQMTSRSRGDAMKPGRESFRPLDSGGALGQNDECRLESIVDVRGIVQPAAADATHQRAVTPYNRREGRFVAHRRELGEHLGIGGRRRVGVGRAIQMIEQVIHEILQAASDLTCWCRAATLRVGLFILSEPHT